MNTLEIMLPFYGPVGLMQDTVRSVLAQDDPDWTLTVVDDGYPDPGVAAWFAAMDDPRVRYLRNETNLGANGNYRRCVELLTGDTCVIMGADDLMLPNYVGTIREARRRSPDAAIIQPGVEVIDETGQPREGLVDAAKRRLYAPRTTRPEVFRGETIAASLVRGNWLYFPSLAWDTAAVRAHGFRTGLDVVQDLALVLDIVADGGALLVDPTRCFRYRRHTQSDSSWRALDGTRFHETRRFFLDEAERFDRLGWPSAATAARRHVSSRIHALSLVPLALRKGHLPGARNLVSHAVGRGAAVD